jgi:hypothetical protein
MLKDMPDRSRKRPRDTNLLAAAIVRAATEGEPDEEDTRDPAAVALGRKGGLVGGKARAAKLSPEQRREIARKAARARWESPAQDLEAARNPHTEPN